MPQEFGVGELPIVALEIRKRGEYDLCFDFRGRVVVPLKFFFKTFFFLSFNSKKKINKLFQ